jgi:hypothetical protein
LVDYPESRTQLVPTWSGIFGESIAGNVMLPGENARIAPTTEVTGKSTAAIKNHLWQATRKGLLERSPGRAGGQFTPRATEILERIVPGAPSHPARHAMDGLISP